MKKIFLNVVFFVWVISVTAQPGQFRRSGSTVERYWILGLGNSTQSMFDEAVSFVRYQGSGMSPAAGLVKKSDRKFRQFIIRPTFNKLTTNRSNDLRPMEVRTTRFVTDYQYLVKAKLFSDKLKLYAGGNVSWLFNMKRAEQLDNSQLLYDHIFSIGAAGKLDKQVYFKKRNCNLSAELQLPLLSHIARPYYLNRIEFIDPKNDFIGDLLRNSSLVSFNKLFKVTSGASLFYPLFNKNALRLSYSWDFYKMRTINSVYAAEHLITIAFYANY